MYLEISARRTGKTMRLIQEFEREGAHGYIVLPHMQMVHIYRDICCALPHQYITVRHLQENEGYQQCKLYWDEFDLTSMGDADYIKDGDYYCTTPSYSRTFKEIHDWYEGKRYDILLSLVAQYSNTCGKDPAKYVYSDAPHLKSMRENVCKAQYNSQFNAKYRYTFEDYMKGEVHD